MTEKACKDCCFSEVVRPDENSIEKVLVCKWGPPQLITVFQQTQAGAMPVTVAQWPQMEGDHWCHRFKKKGGPWCNECGYELPKHAVNCSKSKR